ncbi:MAG: hypothetical protein LUC92_03350, partial [Clostridiales bacterium]|nr:hypothetical protein [Clostridiales bacterium]
CLGDRNDENYKGAIKLLDTITSVDFSHSERIDIIKNDFNIAITKFIEDEVTTMCNLSYGIEKRGEIKGTEKTTVSLLKNAMNNLHFTLEQAMKALGIPENEYSKYRRLVEE